MYSESRGAQTRGAAAGAAPLRVRVVGPDAAEARARFAAAHSSLIKSRVAKPLLTSVGVVTLLGAAVFVLAAVSSTGSTLPWDWTRMDWSVAATRYTACAQHDRGPSTIACMLGTGPGQTSGAGSSAAAGQGAGPIYSFATIPGPAPAGPPAAKSGCRPGTAQGGSHGATHVGQSAHGTGHLGTLPASATRVEIGPGTPDE